MTRSILLAVIGVTALVVNPFFACDDAHAPSYSYDAADMRIAVEGTWKLHVGKLDATLKIKQSAKAERHVARETFVHSAHACSTRTLVRSAAACLDDSEMPLDIKVAGMTTKHRPTGVFVVPMPWFEFGVLVVELDDLEISAKLTPTGNVTSTWVSRGDDTRAASLVRVR
jgi:hypothetical protein